MNKGQAGGLVLFQNRGREYMRELGKREAKAFYERYIWKVVGTSGYALVNRESGKIMATVGSLPFSKG